MTFNYVARRYQIDNPIILKISLNSKVLAKESSYLKAFAKHAAAYLCNPIPELLQENQLREIIANRIKVCSAELNLDAAKINNWLYAKSVLYWPGAWMVTLILAIGKIS